MNQVENLPENKTLFLPDSHPENKDRKFWPETPDPAMEETILNVSGLSVSFGGENVLSGLNFNLKRGENLAIIGPNGAGKTVLLKSLLGIINCEGEAIWKSGVKISYVPQNILPEKTLPLSVGEFFKIKNIGKEKAVALLASVGILGDNFLKKRLGVLSSGQLQRVMVAWALDGNPDVLLFDEPTAGIDIGGEETIFNLLGKIKKEKKMTIIIVSHDMSVVYSLADKVLCLNKKMVCVGAPQEALNPESLKSLYGGSVSFYKHEH